MATPTQILSERRDDVVVLTLNRPEKMNAWTPVMSAELSDAIEEGNDDRSVGAFVITGSGRAFCAGADIGGHFAKQLEGGGDGGSSTVVSGAGPRKGWVDLLRSSKPVVAALNGHSIGVGLTMILPADFIVAAQGAKLSCRFVKMGLVPELASSQFLVHRMGLGHASDFMLSGKDVLADEALALGLVDEVVPGESLLDCAVARARTYAANPTPQLRWIKELITANANDTDLAAVQRREGEALARCFVSPEHKEAVTAFLEKRPPKFR